MPGIEALTRVQWGVEAVAGGTTDPATTYFRGEGYLKDNTELSYPKEKIGILGGTTRSFIPKTGGEITVTSNATFEQLPYIFNSGIKHVNPTTDTSSAQIRTWAMQATDTDPISTTDLDTMVIEGGDNQQAEIMRYSFVSEFSLSGKAGAGLDMSAKFMGRAIATGSFTSGLSIPTVEDILFSMGSLYIDSSSDTIGTTQKSNTLLDMNLKVTTGWVSYGAKDGRTDFSAIKRVDDEVTLDLTFEHDATAVSEKAAWRNQTERALRLTFTGSALSTTDAGATYDTKILVIDLYGKWTKFSELSGQDGNNTVTGTFKAAYSPTAAAKAQFVIANETSSLP